jgi:hypothetical protein
MGGGASGVLRGAISRAHRCRPLREIFPRNRGRSSQNRQGMQGCFAVRQSHNEMLLHVAWPLRYHPSNLGRKVSEAKISMWEVAPGRRAFGTHRLRSLVVSTNRPLTGFDWYRLAVYTVPYSKSAGSQF